MPSEAPHESLPSYFSHILRALSFAIPCLVAVQHANNAADMAHDAGLVRTLGLHGAGLFHGPDLLITGLGQLLPLGTFVFRAGALGSALTGLFGLLTFELAVAVLGSAKPLPLQSPFPAFLQTSDAAGPILALIASLLVSLAPVVQFESTSGGSATLGAILMLAPVVRLLSRMPHGVTGPAQFFCFATLTGLAFAQEPLIGLSALIVSAILSKPALRQLRAHLSLVLVGAALGASPMVFAIADSRREGFRVSWFATALGDPGSTRSLGSFFRNEVGYLELALAALGFGLWVLTNRSDRRIAVALLTLFAMAALSVRLGSAAGPERFSAASLVLAALCAICTTSAISVMVSHVATAAIPFAHASAFMLLVVFLVAPLKTLDDMQHRKGEQRDAAAHLWEEWAFDDVASGTLILVADRRMFQRLRAAQAARTLRSDVDVLPTFALDAPQALAVIAKEPRLTALLRDMILAQSPSELSLSALAAARPIIVEFSPTWDRQLARHLVPAGLFLRYETEPRGLSERRSALERQLPLRDRLAAALGRANHADITDMTVKALRIRSLAMALTGERESTSRALDDLRLFAPKDAFLEELVRRIVLSKGPIDVTGLTPAE